MIRTDEYPEHRRELSVARDSQEAPPDGGGASDRSAEIVQLVRRRSYLDAAREQGVHQEREELLDETAKLRAKVARIRAANGDEVPSAGVISLAAHSPNAAVFAESLTEQRDRMQARLRTIVKIIGASPLAGPWFPTFALMLTDEDGIWTPEFATSYLDACLIQDAKLQSATSTAAESEPRRLNGEGLSGRIHRKDQS